MDVAESRICNASGTHSMPETIRSYCSPVGVWLNWRARASCSGSFCWAAIVLLNIPLALVSTVLGSRVSGCRLQVVVLVAGWISGGN